MYIYNTTFGIEPSVKDDVMNWLRTEFIPSGDGIPGEDTYIFRPEILRIMNGEPGIVSLAVHFRVDSLEDIDHWYADHGSRLFSYVNERWNGKVVFFSTTLEIL